MHPPEFHAPDGDNPAERKLFDALRDSLPDSWQAFHSIDWLERNPDEGGRVGEIDFVLAHPEAGILTLEVKGGGIECNHGAWRRKKPGGAWEPMKDPLKQVRDNQFALERLLKRMPEWPIDKPLMSHGLALASGRDALLRRTHASICQPGCRISPGPAGHFRLATAASRVAVG